MDHTQRYRATERVVERTVDGGRLVKSWDVEGPATVLNESASLILDALRRAPGSTAAMISANVATLSGIEPELVGDLGPVFTLLEQNGLVDRSE